jgi:hypothetical protein
LAMLCNFYEGKKNLCLKYLKSTQCNAMRRKRTKKEDHSYFAPEQ